jgi:acetyl-CoA decarbonylase/synthase complex subunit delta
VASSPIDINLAKQLNILLGNLGVPDAQIVVDPTTGGLGSGIEYTYSVMERDRMAALTQQDERLQFPILCNMAREVWKTKEAKHPQERPPGTQKEDLMELPQRASAGGSRCVMRHPRPLSWFEMISDLIAK